MNAPDAVSSLQPSVWSQTSAKDRLELLKTIQSNLDRYQDELVQADAQMKKELSQSNNVSPDLCKLTTIVPMANNLAGAVDLYTSLCRNKDFGSSNVVTKVSGDNDYYDIRVAPNASIKEKILYLFRQDTLRVVGVPEQILPYDKPTDRIAVLGAGNYSGAVEIIKALFFDNCVVATKPHPINEKTEQIWQKVFEPLVQMGALAFCDAHQGEALIQDPRIDKVYFTGGRESARSILQSTDKPVVCELGGVNPMIITPSTKTWSSFALRHHAQQIVSVGKLNGGHICARPQLLVTCKQWPQRQAFLEEVERAIQSTTFGVASYYPGRKETVANFKKECLDAKVIRPESSGGSSEQVLLSTDQKEDSFGVQTEAFAQVFVEVALDTALDADEFLAEATIFCNNKVQGTLCANILIDGKTRRKHKDALDQAVTNLKFGTVGVNLNAINAFTSPYLYWGGHDDDEQGLVSGLGSFGNLFGYKNTVKSILDDSFISLGQIKFNNLAATRRTSSALANFTLVPTWTRLMKLLGVALVGFFKKKDW